MRRFTKMLLLSSTLLALPGISNAEVAIQEKYPLVSDLEINISAYGNFQAATRHQSKLEKEKDEKNISKHNKSLAFYSDAAVVFNIANTVDELTYGGKIVLVPTTKRKGGSYNGSHIYLEGNLGKVEAGAPVLPAAKMMLDGSSITAGSCDWDRYASLETENLKQGTPSAPSFATYDEFILSDKLLTSSDKRKYSTEPPRGVAYYTPKFDLGTSTKLQFGVGYVPDTSNTGADNPGTQSSGKSEQKISELTTPGGGGAEAVFTEYELHIDRSLKNAVSAGITLEQNISDGVDFKIAITGEHGKAVGKIKKYKKGKSDDDADPLATYKLSNLKAYNIGASLSIGNISCAGSFGSLGNSLTAKEVHKTNRKTSYYTGAVAYNQGPFGASVGYFKSTQYKNTVDAITIGAHYTLAPGLKPYAEISTYNLKGRPETRTDLEKKKVRGTVALIGAKLSL